MNLNNKGFTLIELIATIALLAVIAIISFVSINGVVNQSKVNDCESLIMNIKSATKEYFSDRRYDSLEYVITANKLIENKYLTGPIKNPFTKEEIDPKNIGITIKPRDDDDYSVDTITVKNMIENRKIDCENNEW